jgi:VWFA-related protein
MIRGRALRIASAFLALLAADASAQLGTPAAPGQAGPTLSDLSNAVGDADLPTRSREWAAAELRKRLGSEGLTDRQRAYLESRIPGDFARAEASWTERQKASAAETAPEQEVEDVIRTDTDLVIATVRAFLRTGEPVTDLDPNEFKIFENGVARDYAAIDLGAQRLDLVLIFDMSGSMDAHAPVLAAAAERFISQLAPGDRVAILGFSGEPFWLTQGYTSDRASLSQALGRLRHGAGGSTNYYGGLMEGIRFVNQSPASRSQAVVFFSDGVHNAGPVRSDEVLHAVQEIPALFYPIQFAPAPGEALPQGIRQEMEKLARDSGGKYFLSPQVQDLAQVYDRIVADLRRQYRVAFKPSAICEQDRNAKLTIAVRTIRQGVAISGRTRYPCPRR